MALFAVIALKDSAVTVDAAVEAKTREGSRYKLESGKWMVDSDLTTARELSTSLGLRETATHLVLSVRGYSGRSQPDLWEWLVAKSEKS
ncbi:MAG: hypothetical protein LAO79_26040 [Acidobacteriia bacterium]|nr:hypothetical protein [Terriglobia bacterium]